MLAIGKCLRGKAVFRIEVYYANGFNTPRLATLHLSAAGIEPT
jgi:hypothetical protein